MVVIKSNVKSLLQKESLTKKRLTSSSVSMKKQPKKKSVHESESQIWQVWTAILNDHLNLFGGY